jgi:glycosyltransferase involved in cell wall biosynthesis
MKKVLIIDWLDKYGGAERVLASITTILDFNKCYTLVNLMDRQDVSKVLSYKKTPIIQTELRVLGKNFRLLFFLFPYFIKRLKVDKDTRLIVSSSFSVAKGIKKTGKNQIHICYYQARNQRYLWDNKGIYFNALAKIILFPALAMLKKLDIQQSRNPDYIIANSRFVQKWIKNKYKRDAFVIYPPVDTKKFVLNNKKEDYYVTAARLEPYKRVDLLVSAFNQINDKLIIIGSGSQKKRLIKHANNNIEFVEYSSSNKVYSIVSRAKAFLHAGTEDFGIALVEAQACGTPVIAYGDGGALETVINGKTGILFNDQTPEAILAAIKRFNQTKFDYSQIRKNSERFSVENFERNFKKYILNKTKEWQEENKEDSQDILDQ